jgi:hypothetical protein
MSVEKEVQNKIRYRNDRISKLEAELKILRDERKLLESCLRPPKPIDIANAVMNEYY